MAGMCNANKMRDSAAAAQCINSDNLPDTVISQSTLTKLHILKKYIHTPSDDRKN
jgi:hypothetical protein